MIDKTIFRKYDVRGLYPQEIDEDAAYKIALAFTSRFPGSKRIAVGGDIRRSTPSLKDAMIKGLQDGGAQVIDVGIVITPVVFFAVCKYGYDAGIVVTASHLEGKFNGIKIVLKDAIPTTPHDYEAIQDIIESGKMKKVDNPDRYIESKDAEKDYEEYLISRFKAKHPLDIVIDTGNGTARLLPERILKRMGHNVTTIFSEPDDSSPNHIADPYKHENMQDLKKEVLARKADLGIGFDGDGDRAGFVDKTGHILSGDELLMIYARHSLERKKGPIAVDSRASLALIEEIENSGQDIHLTVGYHAAVLSKIMETGAVFGGETTCHFYFPLDFYLTDDAVVAALKLIEIASGFEDFAGYVKSLPHYATSQEIFIPFPDTEKYISVQDFTDRVKKEGYRVNDIDGARIDFPNGWGIVRPSNTSPFIKVKFEGRTIEDLKDVAEKMKSLLEGSGIIVPADEMKKILS